MTLARRQILHLAAGAAALSVLPPAAMAQGWPSRVVRLVVGFPAGGGADAVARILANRLSEIWGQQVIIDNRGGAGGNLAFDAAAHAPPDGHTMLFGTLGVVVNRFLYASVNYDPFADFAPVSLIGKYANLLVVPTSAPIKTLQEFIAAGKARDGRLTYASPGVGTSPHLSGELFKRMAGIEMTHVPYRGVGAGGMNDLLAGRVDSMFNTTASLIQSVRAGQLRGLAVTTAERVPTAPEFPTIAESGVPGFDVSSWYALLVPTKTPVEILRKMHADTVAMLGEPAMKARFQPLGIELVGSTPAEAAAKLRAESDLWGPIITAANIKGE